MENGLFKTELHSHTIDASPCSTLTAEKLVELYVEKNYDSVVIANHFTHRYMNLYEIPTYKEYVEFYIEAYEKLKRIAGDKLNIIFGAELRFDDVDNDYLWIGADIDYLRKNDDILNLGTNGFREVCTKNGWLFIQAHPFRHTMKVVDPKMVDGVEVYNAKNESFRNFIADKWADHFGLIKTSGTDIHKPHETPKGGILTAKKMETMQDVLEVIKSGNYKLVTE